MIFVLVYIALCHFKSSWQGRERERELAALILLSFGCLVNLNVW